MALAKTCARPGAAAIVAEREVHVPPGPVDDMLLDLLEEVVFALDVAEGIPIRARLLTSGHGGPEARLALADPAGVEPAGPFPRPSPGPASR